MNKDAFISLCEKYGCPDDVPLDEMPATIGRFLSMADRFFDTPESTQDAVRVLEAVGYFE